MNDQPKILLVQDLKIARSILGQMLEKKGFHVTAPASAQQIFQAASRTVFDFIVMDLDTGDDALQVILEKISGASPRNIPCIGLAKHLSPSVINRCKTYQFLSCVKQPAIAEEIAEIIDQSRRNASGHFFLPGKSSLCTLDLAEAFNAIEQLGRENDHEGACKLFRYIDDPESEEALVAFASDTVKQMITENIDLLLFGLLKGGRRTAALCASTAEEKGLKKAGPYLLMSLKNAKEISSIARALSAFRNIEYSKSIPFLKKYSRHRDTMVSLAAIEALSGQDPAKACPVLVKCLETDEEIRAYAAAEALGEAGGDSAVAGLSGQIHHKSPQVRKAVTAALIKNSSQAVAFVCQKLSSSRDDEVIMAANILGDIRDDAATEPLCKTSDHPNHNVRFGVFEALGKIGSERAVNELVRGTADRDYTVVCAAVQGIDSNPFDIHKALMHQINSDPGVRENIISAVSDMKAVNVFNQLYRSSETLIDIIKTINGSKNRKTILSFLTACDRIQKRSARKGAEMMLNRALRSLPEIEARILAVDDSIAILNFYQSVLSRASFHVVTAEDGGKALEKISMDSAFDLILTDMNMPVKNGIELAKHIREHTSLTVPIVLVTTESEKTQKDQAMEAGVNAFLTKPVSSTLLQETVRKFCKTALPDSQGYEIGSTADLDHKKWPR